VPGAPTWSKARPGVDGHESWNAVRESSLGRVRLAVSDDRLTLLLGLVAVQRKGGLSLPGRVCWTCVDAMSVSGAVMALVSRRGHGGTVAATDPRSRGVDERQYTLGEGPSVDAFAAGRPALEPNLGTVSAAAKWPAFSRTAQASGLAAAFAFPLSLGTMRVGALGLYRDEPGCLSETECSDGSLLATIATLVLIAMHSQVISPFDDLHPLIESTAGPAVVHQATGMVMVQLGVTIKEAFVVLRAYAFAHDRSIASVAADVVARRIVLG
jgi:hypothetical protein